MTAIAGLQVNKLETAVLTVEQMRSAEEAAMDAGISGWELMRRAGQGAAQWAARMAAGRSVAVLCGPGNNGGDGYVIAEDLRARGMPVNVIASKSPSTETARRARDQYAGDISDCGDIEADVIIDCLFGYGLSRPVEGEFARLLTDLVDHPSYKIAIDVPSSVESDSGEVLGPLPDYDLTLALGAWKRAHFLMPACAKMGATRLVDIGIGVPEASDRLSKRPMLRAPAPGAHKYRRGLVAIVGGEMSGAAMLSAQAAMRGGAGYVKLLANRRVPSVPADLVVDGGEVSTALEDDRIGAILIGPGLGRRDAAKDRLSLALEAKRPTVLDADALHLLDRDLVAKADASRILVTPHEGELAALCRTFGVTASGKIDRARTLHDVTGMTVLAKGPDTILAGQNGMRFFERGSSWLSIAGSGDVLAGIAVSRLAAGNDPMSAAEEAVWLHHHAAELAGPAFTASELALCVGKALEAFL